MVRPMRIGDLAIGNAIGSNIANMGLVLGLTAMIAPLPVHKNRLKREMPTVLIVTILCGLLLIDGELDFSDGVLMLAAAPATNKSALQTEYQRQPTIYPTQHVYPFEAKLAFLSHCSTI